MKMETGDHEQIRSEIHQLVQGAKQAQETDTAEAVRLYEEAYKKSRLLDDDKLERECALNLGAAHLARKGNAEVGKNYLHKAMPENTQDVPDSYLADLYFNKGIAFEELCDTEEALKMFDKAWDTYKNDAVMDKQCFFSIGRIFCKMAIHQWLDPEKKRKAKPYADKCRQLNLSRLSLGNKDYVEVSQIYNEVGLFYTQLQCYDEALQCFEKAAELCKQSGESHRDQLMAVICQNRGAVYNFQEKYEESIKFHQEADKMYTKINSYKMARNGQGQCYINLAYAYFQRHVEEGDFLMDDAFRTFSDAKKAAKDTGDKNMLWQAYEGLGVVYFHRGQYHESVKQYKEAVRIISDEDNSNRVVDKLEQALEYKMAQEQSGAFRSKLLRSNLPITQLQAGQTQHMKSAVGGAEGPITLRNAEVPMPTDDKKFKGNVTVMKGVRRGQIRMRKKDSFGPHLPKVAQGFGVLSQRPSTLTSRDVAESPTQRPTSGLDTENMTEESSSGESETVTDSSEDDDVETEDKNVGTSSKVQEIFRKPTATASGMSPVRDETQRDLSLRQYENMLQQKEANEDQSKDGSEDDSDEDSEEEESTTDDDTSTDDDDDDEDGEVKKSKSTTHPGQNDANKQQSPLATTSDIDPPYATIGTFTWTRDDDTAEGSRGFHTVKNDGNQRIGDDDDNVMLENLPRGERERILHEQHVKRRKEEDAPPPLPDRKEKSKTCVIM